MAEKLVASVTVQDEAKQKAVMSVDFGEAVLGNWFDKSDNLAEIVADYSDGYVVKLQDSTSHIAEIPDDYEWGDSQLRMVDQKAVLTFLVKGLTFSRNLRMELPAPKPAIFYKVEEKGWRVLKEVGDIIAGKLESGLDNVLGTVSVTFKKGWLKSKQ
jgi:hypothetical protein